MNDKEIYGMNEVLSNVFRNIDETKIQQGNDILKVWEDTVQKIYKYGSKIAGHTRVVDLKNGILLVETDHPGWSQILNTYKDFIIKGIKMKIKDLEINTLAFKLKGTNAALSETYEENKEKIQQDYLKKIENEEKQLEEMGFNNKNSKTEINPEVADLFKGFFEKKNNNIE